MKRLFLIAIFSGSMAVNAIAQEFHMPKPSPTVTVDQGFSTSFIKLNYSRPSARGRVIFGNVVPYGQVWRTGANSATTVTFGEDVSIDGNLIKAGVYALYTIPEKNDWTIILNSGVKNWGDEGFKKEDDVLRFKVPVTHLKDFYQETFRISIENLRSTSCNIVLSWANVMVSIPVTTDNNARIMAHLDQELKGSNPPYAAAAAYYLSSNQKLETAAKYEQMAIEKNPKAYYLNWHLAQIYQKLGRHQDAVKNAEIAAQKAKGTVFADEYERKYQEILKEK